MLYPEERDREREREGDGGDIKRKRKRRRRRRRRMEERKIWEKKWKWRKLVGKKMFRNCQKCGMCRNRSYCGRKCAGDDDGHTEEEDDEDKE